MCEWISLVSRLHGLSYCLCSNQSNERQLHTMHVVALWNESKEERYTHRTLNICSPNRAGETQSSYAAERLAKPMLLLLLPLLLLLLLFLFISRLLLRSCFHFKCIKNGCALSLSLYFFSLVSCTDMYTFNHIESRILCSSFSSLQQAKANKYTATAMLDGCILKQPKRYNELCIPKR